MAVGPLTIFIRGHMDGVSSFDSPSGGEDRWLINIGHMMALQGHRVGFRGASFDFSSPLSGACDVYLTFFQEEYHSALVNVYCQCGVTEESLGIRTRFPRRQGGPLHFAAVSGFPALERRIRDLPEIGDFCRVLPWPTVESCSLSSNFGKPYLAFWSKKIYEQHYAGTVFPELGMNMLRAAVRIAEELGLQLHFLRCEYALDRPLMDPELTKMIRGHPMVVRHENMPRAGVLAILRDTRLVMSDYPSISQLPLEAVALGAVQQRWHGDEFPEDGPFVFRIDPSESYILGEVKDTLKAICTDRASYDALLESERAEARRYTYDSAYPWTLRALSEMIREASP